MANPGSEAPTPGMDPVVEDRITSIIRGAEQALRRSQRKRAVLFAVPFALLVAAAALAAGYSWGRSHQIDRAKGRLEALQRRGNYAAASLAWAAQKQFVREALWEWEHPRPPDSYEIADVGGAPFGMVFVKVQDFLEHGRCFYMGRHEVTKAQYSAFLKGSKRAEPPPASFAPFAPDEGSPAVGMTWAEACAFCEWLTEGERERGFLPSDEEYRLPLEAEWVHSAGGSAPAYPWGNARDFFSRANLRGETDGYPFTAPVGKFQGGGSERGGVLDLCGNVKEWCLDPWSPYPVAGQDPRRASKEAKRLLKGGGWNSDPETATVAYREFLFPNARDPEIGFRCLRCRRPGAERADARPAGK
jgi:hypothetical protein